MSVPEVVQVGDLLHAEPAELAAADGAGHVVAAPVVHLDDVGAAAGAGLDVVGWGQKRDESDPTVRGGFRNNDSQLLPRQSVAQYL